MNINHYFKTKFIMNKVEFLLIQLEGMFYLECPDLYYNFLNDGIDNHRFSDNSLNMLYQWRNGMKIAQIEETGKYEFCGLGYFLPYAEARAFQKQFIEDKCFDKDSYLPVIASLGGDFLLVDTKKKSSKVYVYSPGLLIDHPMEAYASIESFVEAVYECFRQKAYRYDEDCYLQINDELEKEITLKYNPMSAFWQGK